METVVIWLSEWCILSVRVCVYSDCVLLERLALVALTRNTTTPLYSVFTCGLDKMNWGSCLIVWIWPSLSPWGSCYFFGFYPPSPPKVPVLLLGCDPLSLSVVLVIVWILASLFPWGLCSILFGCDTLSTSVVLFIVWMWPSLSPWGLCLIFLDFTLHLFPLEP